MATVNITIYTNDKVFGWLAEERARQILFLVLISVLCWITKKKK